MGIGFKRKPKTLITEVRCEILFLKTKPINLLRARGIGDKKNICRLIRLTIHIRLTLGDPANFSWTGGSSNVYGGLPTFPQWQVLGERMIGQLDFNYPA